MSTTYDGANSFPTSLTIPSDGDAEDAASVNVPIEGLADRTVKLKSDLNGTNDGAVILSSAKLIGAGQLADGLGNFGTLAARGTGFFAKRSPVDGPDSDHTFNVIDGDVIFVPTLTGDRIWTIGDTGIIGGAGITIFNESAVFKITLKRSDGSAFAEVGVGSAQYPWLDLITNGSAHAWRIFRGTVNP